MTRRHHVRTSPRPSLHDLQASYDEVADEYVRRIGDELRGKPFDRELLDRFASRVGSHGAVWDVGSGPGHVTRYLRDRGANVAGLDLSAKLVAGARQLRRCPCRRGRPGRPG